jgi:hypothetical protein
MGGHSRELFDDHFLPMAVFGLVIALSTLVMTWCALLFVV